MGFAVVAILIALGGAPTLLQTAIAGTVGEDADIAQSMLVTVFNLAVAGGGLLGGLLLQKIGPASFNSNPNLIKHLSGRNPDPAPKIAIGGTYKIKKRNLIN